MANASAPLRRIEWDEVCPWLSLFRALWLAVHPAKLVLAATGLVVMTAGWCLLDTLFSQADSPRQTPWPWEGVAATTDLGQGETSAPESAEAAGDAAVSPAATIQAGLHVLRQIPVRLSQPFWNIFQHGASVGAIGQALLYGLWALVVWSVFGGAISRIAAVQLAQDRRYGLVRSLRHALAKMRSTVSAPLLPLLGVALLSIPLLVAGWMAIPGFGYVIVGVLWFLALVLGVLMALLLAGVALGWPLMIASVAVESTDAFDAVSAAYAFVYQRPFRYLFYVVLALGIGTAGVWAVTHLAALTLYLGAWGASWGATAGREQELFRLASLTSSLSGQNSAGSHVLGFWIAVARTLVAGFAYSFFFTALTGIYFLLRYDTEGKPLDAVALEEDLEETYTLPSLPMAPPEAPATGATGPAAGATDTSGGSAEPREDESSETD
jgi:hypothetical protein